MGFCRKLAFVKPISPYPERFLSLLSFLHGAGALAVGLPALGVGRPHAPRTDPCVSAGGRVFAHWQLRRLRARGVSCPVPLHRLLVRV